ncbi:M6 family metalloprotease domain-containing protein [Streptomyces sulfonofaciens]|uniref:M6 family metalloprotease domain-containing protein n=1 Tax=Streptomyces sulfonofaciens TaxID=68272 RepID=A0A919G8P0_9ACTN|nr:M6 family metalloprotease domain-containing protein [Streptomyces sulfonofaciens]GHH80212.1 M6 family metalloprotease domain-containing protein [Streptomyces sulfonofaciens]
MQPTGRLIRGPRRTVPLTALTTLALAVTVSSSTAPRSGGPGTAAGPIAPPRTAALGPCMISGSLGVQMSEGVPTAPGYAHSTGTVHALNLMIDFPDTPGQGSALERLDEFFPQTRNWFRAASYGRLDYLPRAPVRHWLRMPRTFKAYGIERGAPFEPGYRKLVDDIIAKVDPVVDFRDYDLLNVLMTPNAGPSALNTVLSVTFAGNHDAPMADGVPVSNVSFVYSRQDDGSGSYARTGYRVLPHENGHIFGLPDLYTRQGGGSVGHWDIMSEDWGANNDLLAWHKWKLGWLDDDQVDCAPAAGASEHVLTPLAGRGGTKLVFVPLGATTGLAAEVRTRAGNDEAVCRPGVLVYRVDADVDTGEGPVTVYDATRHSGGCTRSPNVHAELSDATFTPGHTFRDRASGVRITVLSVDARGAYRVRISRR